MCECDSTKPSNAKVMDERMNMEHWCNDTDTEKQKHLEKILCQCHFVYHKAHMGFPEIEPGRWRWPPGEYALNPWYGPYLTFRQPKILVQVSRGFPVYLQANVGYFKLCRGRFLLQTFKFTACYRTVFRRHVLWVTNSIDKQIKRPVASES